MHNTVLMSETVTETDKETETDRQNTVPMTETETETEAETETDRQITGRIIKKTQTILN